MQMVYLLKTIWLLLTYKNNLLILFYELQGFTHNILTETQGVIQYTR